MAEIFCLIFISLQLFFKLFIANFVTYNIKYIYIYIYNDNHYSKLHSMILFSFHVNCSTTNAIQNIFINLRAIKVRVIVQFLCDVLHAEGVHFCSFVTKSNEVCTQIFTQVYWTVSIWPSYTEGPTNVSQAPPPKRFFHTFHYGISSFYCHPIFFCI